MKRCGYEILERNFRCRTGELDIVAKKEDTLYFIEVKARRSLRCGVPAEAVTKRKKQHILRTVRHYLISHYIIDTDIQIDLIELLLMGEKSYIRHTENIFS